ncbi:hypothetical protein [Paracoccus siganidrum]|uniref:hypothetical protein n=1 Tax=Paracoccus siganidrum TaxID=1276757 RepID=UPI0011C3BFB6|nr:hypothetical protein [Paracoccus siganidrum]
MSGEKMEKELKEDEFSGHTKLTGEQNALLYLFSLNNDYIKFDPVEEELLAFKPWNDSALQIELHQLSEESPPAVKELMEHCVLPPKLTAILHLDKNELEIIYTSFKKAVLGANLSTRSFEITHNGITRVCRFSPASQRLIELSRLVDFVGPTDNNYRNLFSFKLMDLASEEDLETIFISPLSFYISNVSAINDELIAFIRTLNFYMSYFDHSTPRVMVHEEVTAKGYNDQGRYRHESFPDTIDAEELDVALLTYWDETFTDNNFLRFIYLFRIVENVSMSYASDTLRSKVKHLVSRPDVRAKKSEIIDLICEAVNSSDTKVLDDFLKFERTVGSISETVLWQEIDNNRDYFSSAQHFDGGYTLPALIGKNDTIDDFIAKGLSPVSRSMRDIRNALAHGKDLIKGGVILPTANNSMLLQPWVYLAQLAAGEVLAHSKSR